MLVDLKDGQCRSCKGQLEIVDVDDVSMAIVCAECGDSYEVETDAFGDGCMTYYFAIMTRKLMEGDES